MSGGKKAAGFDVPKDAMMKMMGSFTLLRLTSMLGMANVSFTKEELLSINKTLNKINQMQTTI